MINKSDLSDLVFFALSSEKIVKLINEKEKTIDKLTHKQTSGYFEPKPSLTPKDDLNFPKEKSLSKGLKDAQRNKIEQVRSDFDNKIEAEARNNIEKNGYEHHKEKMNKLTQYEVITLLENNGVDKVYELLQEKEKATYKDNIETKKNYLDSSTLDKIQFNEQEMDHLMQDNYSQAFEENTKDMNVDIEPPEPSGDYE
ncbi:hypothetical protein KORDIASMS9_02817 [Kordia sp. SMS9]|uniref:hypothetical protein n=1 Tax=Kordia sp. SMS9 TaxID=2282170 RepID=UPI000E0DE1D6|nr:hypothetical protein [Kordia sp. SMS9]AXG70577.1 hypothetical protein KORDIASMS9_02817 [Kordia sp. SMS9]